LRCPAFLFPACAVLRDALSCELSSVNTKQKENKMMLVLNKSRCWFGHSPIRPSSQEC
jgi:hypothetical protein